MTFDVLLVCTGNLCRSPMAERLFRARLNGAPADVRVLSAGTQAVAGYAMDLPSARVLSALGGNPEGHIAQQVTADMVADAGLILTAGTAHRAQLVRESPAAMRRVFTLREFARLGAALGPPRSAPTGDWLARRVAEVAGQRGQVEAPEAGADEIADPIGAPLPEVQRVGHDISAAVDAALRILGLSA